MTVEADLIAALDPLVSSRVYADLAPPDVVTPYIVHQKVGGRAINFLERAVASKKNGRFQVAVWATTRAAAEALSLQIESAIVLCTSFQVEVLGAAVSDYDEETELRGSRQDFSIWSDR